MKYKSAWIFLIILVAIAAYFFLVEEKRKTAGERAEKASRELVSYGPGDVEKIVLINPDGERIEMERRGEGWMITSPIVTRGAGSTIDILLKQLVPGRKIEEFPGVEELADFGLDDPFATAILHSREGSHPDTIHIGDKTPTSSKCYIRLGSSRNVVITREMTHNVMNKNLFHLRDKNFVSISIDSIDAVTIANGDLRISLAKRDMTWWMEERGVRADRIKIEKYLLRLTQAIVYGFVSEDARELDRYGLERPQRTITIRRKTGITKISFGSKKNGLVHVLRSDLDKVLLLKEDLLGIFDLGERNIRSRDLTFLDADLVKGLRYETADTAIAIRARNGEWTVQGSDAPAIRPYEVADFLRMLRGIKFEGFLDEQTGEPADRYAPFALRLEMEDREGNVIELIRIASPFADYEVGTSRSSNSIGRLKKHTLSQIQRHFTSMGVIRQEPY